MINKLSILKYIQYIKKMIYDIMHIQTGKEIETYIRQYSL